MFLLKESLTLYLLDYEIVLSQPGAQTRTIQAWHQKGGISALKIVDHFETVRGLF